MYHLYRYFASRGHSADFIHIVSALPSRLRDLFQLVPVRVHR